MATSRPFWKWHHWKSIGFCLWPPSTCTWNLKLKFQSKLDLCSGNHVVYRQTDGRTDKVNPVYPPPPTPTPHPPTSLGGGMTRPMLRKPCRLQTDRRTDGQGESNLLPSNFVGWGIITFPLLQWRPTPSLYLRVSWLRPNRRGTLSFLCKLPLWEFAEYLSRSRSRRLHGIDPHISRHWEKYIF